MLNKNGERELAYIVEAQKVEPHPNADRLDVVTVNGWQCIVGKNEIKPGDLCVYFEIDSKLPDEPPFNKMEFLKQKDFKIKTQKIRGVVSQGLLIPVTQLDVGFADIGDGVTKQLKVTYNEAADNVRKSAAPDRYKKMCQRHPQLAQTALWRLLYKTKLGKALLFALFGRKVNKTDWPEFVIKTDEERIENMPWLLKDSKTVWQPSEKIDGTSTTFAAWKGKFGKIHFVVCSRNVAFTTDKKRCFYESNYYTEMAEKYGAREFLTTVLENNKDLKWVYLQGETFGQGVQKNDYGMDRRSLKVFNLVDSNIGRWPSKAGRNFVESNSDMKWVPLLEEMTLPGSVEELRKYVHGQSTVNGKLREGVVFRDLDGKKSFKCVDPEYLMKYHS